MELWGHKKQRYSQDAVLIQKEEELLAMESAALSVVSTLPLEVSKAGHGNVSNANKEWGSDQIVSRC